MTEFQYGKEQPKEENAKRKHYSTLLIYLQYMIEEYLFFKPVISFHCLQSNLRSTFITLQSNKKTLVSNLPTHGNEYPKIGSWTNWRLFNIVTQ